MRALSSVFVTALVLAGSAELAPLKAEESPVTRGEISVVGSGFVEALPDLVEIDFQAEKVANSVEEGRTFVDKAVSGLLDACADLGVDRSAITATDLNIGPRSTYDTPNSAVRFEGYSVSRGVTVRLTKLNSFNELVRRAIQAGMNGINRIAMKSSKDHDLQEQALLAAIRDAKRQAEAIARETGRQVDRVSTVATEDAQRWNGYTPGSQYVTVTAERMPEFQPGPIKISTRVFMTCTTR